MRAATIATTVFLIVLLTGCKNSKEDLVREAPADYVPLQTGKYLTYRLDSLVFPQAGRGEETHYYQEKNVVDAQITDNLGRPSYRIFRYLRDTAATQAWQPAGTYFITVTDGTLEVVEDNMRVLKLVTPIKESTVWKGNRFLANEPYASKYNFNNDDNMEDWDFKYISVKDTFIFKQKLLENVISVVRINEINVVDTVDALSNKAILPKNSNGVFLRGSATDTIRIEAQKPDSGFENIMVYNQTNKYASFNNILIPPGLAFPFQFSDNRWFYPNNLPVKDNKVILPKNVSVVYISGVASNNIQINTTNIDPNNISKINIYNKSNFNAFPDFNTTLNAIGIPPGFGRSYEYFNNQWRLSGNSNLLLDKDPYINELPLGSKNFYFEKYAQGIGMVFQEIIMWEYQPNTGGTPYKIGFGVKRTLIDYN